MKAFLRKRTSSRAPPPDHQTSSVQTTTPVAPIETPLYARFAKTSLTEPAPAPTRPVVSGPMPLGQRPSMDTARDDKRKRTQSARTRTTSTSQASSRLPTPARSPAILSPMSSGPSLPEQNSTSSSTTTSYFAHSRSATSPDEFSSRLASAQSPMSSRPALRDDRSGLASSATPRQTNARALPEGPNLIPPPSISSDAPRIPSAILPEESTLRFLSLADSGFFDSPSRNEKPLPSLTPPKSSLSLPQSASSSQRTIPSNQSDTLSQYLATPPPASSVPNLMSRTRKTTLRPNDEAKTEAPARSLTALASPRKTQHALPPERGRASEEARVGRDGLGSAVTTPPSSSPPNSARLTASAGAFSVTTLRAGDRMAKDAFIPSPFADQRLPGAAPELPKAAAPKQKTAPERGDGRQNANEVQMRRDRERALYREPMPVPAPPPPASANPPPRRAVPVPAPATVPPPPVPSKPERERRKLRKAPSIVKQDPAPTPPSRDTDEHSRLFHHHHHHHDRDYDRDYDRERELERPHHHHHTVLRKTNHRAEQSSSPSPAPEAHLPVLTPPQSPDDFAPDARFEQFAPVDEFVSRAPPSRFVPQQLQPPPQPQQQRLQPRGPVRGRPLIFANMNEGTELGDPEPQQTLQQAPVRRGPLIFHTRDHEESVEAAWEKQRHPSPERERERELRPAPSIAQLRAAGHFGAEETSRDELSREQQLSPPQVQAQVLPPQVQPLWQAQPQAPSQAQAQAQPPPQAQAQPQPQSPPPPPSQQMPPPSASPPEPADWHYWYSRPRYKSMPTPRHSQPPPPPSQELPPLPPPAIEKDVPAPTPVKPAHHLHHVNGHIGHANGNGTTANGSGRYAVDTAANGNGNGKYPAEAYRHRPITPVSPNTPQQTLPLPLGPPVEIEPRKSVAETDAMDIDSTAATVDPTPRTSVVISNRPLPSLPPAGGLQTPSDDEHRRTPSPVKQAASRAQYRKSVPNVALSGDFEPVAEMQGHGSDLPNSRPGSNHTVVPPPTEPVPPTGPPTPPSPEEYSVARAKRRGHALPKVSPPSLNDLIEQTRPKTPPPPTFYPLARHMQHPALLSGLLFYLTFRDWLALWAVNKKLRADVEEARPLREEVLERFLGIVGYVRWPTPGAGEDAKEKWDRDEPIRLSLRQLAAYMQGVSLPPHAFARIPIVPELTREMKRAARSYTRVVLRLREQAEAEDRALALTRRLDRGLTHARQRSEGPPPSWSNGASGLARRSASRQSSRAPSPTFSTYSHNNGSHSQLPTPTRSTGSNSGRFQSPLFRLRRAPLLRVFVRSPEGDWLSDASVLECEAELRKAGVLPLMRAGDVVWDTAVGDEGNVGRLVWDGRYLIDLDYTYSQTGDLPGYLPNLAFPPSYFHRVIRTAGEHKNPVVHIDVTPWGEEIAANLQLLQDRVRTETPQGTYHTVVRWTHRSSFQIRAQHPRTRAHPAASPLSITLPTGERRAIDPGWVGTVVVEAEGTNEGLADLQRRCGKAFPPRVGSEVKGDRERGVWRILRERSRPGEIWIRAVSYKERLIP